MAGRVLRISPPRDRSNETHQTSPLLIGGIRDQPFVPFAGLRLPVPILRHRTVTRDKVTLGRSIQVLEPVQHRALEGLRKQKPGRPAARLRVAYAWFVGATIEAHPEPGLPFPFDLR